MKNNRIILYIVLVVCIVSFTGIAAAQSLRETQDLVKEEAAMAWKDCRGKVTENQSIEFEGDKMIVTVRAVFKNNRENIQTAIIPLDQVDVTKMNSYLTTNPEEMYYLSIFTKNKKDAIKVTTFYGKDVEDNIVETFYYTLYSKTRKQNLALKAKIEHLIYLLDKNN